MHIYSHFCILQCAEHNPCFKGRCVNTAPGYQCYACPSGYEGTYEDAYAWNVHQRVFLYGNMEYSNLTYQDCDDIDECAVYSGICPEHMPCVNTPVSMSKTYCVRHIRNIKFYHL